MVQERSQAAGVSSGEERWKPRVVVVVLVVGVAGFKCSLQPFDYLQQDERAEIKGSSGGARSDAASAGSGGADVGTGGDIHVDVAQRVDGAQGSGGTGTAGARPEAGGGMGGYLDASVELDADTDSGPSIDSTCDLCTAQASLIHRYTFDGTGTEAEDSIGNAHGTVVNTQLSGAGTVTTDGTTNSYIAFPAGILSGLTDVTLEVWVTWKGGSSYQRILDFGNSTGQEGATSGETFILLCASCPTRLRGGYRASSTLDLVADSYGALPTGVLSQVALVFKDASHRLSLYLNGTLAASVLGLQPLANIHDMNNWLGRSQYSTDPTFYGTYHDFRIYRAALTPGEIQASYVAGPNQ